MNLLITAGNTQARIDRVRCITNIFTGRTGANIAIHAWKRGHTVSLLTSHPEVVEAMNDGTMPTERWNLLSFATYEDLQNQMAILIPGGGFDGVIHCAAVSDYLPAGVYAPTNGFDAARGQWLGEFPRMLDRAAEKVKSDEPELWIRFTRAPKLIDRIRTDWEYRRILVKFKLEVGVSDQELLEIAERSRQHSNADMMVANTLEEADRYAFIGAKAGAYHQVTRAELPGRLLNAVETLHREGAHG
jgi:phosphopantothenate-cysteine ligase/phosphopantothenoylcysteine decarboxylase/phosphopantothenate--cysteine ligase